MKQCRKFHVISLSVMICLHFSLMIDAWAQSTDYHERSFYPSQKTNNRNTASTEKLIFYEDWESGSIDPAKWDKYGSPVIIDNEVIEQIEKIAHLAPLHNPVNLMGIKACMALIPDVPQVAVFDTGFHQKMPQHAYLYGIPYEYYKEDHIRKYGFHGISHDYLSLRTATYLKRTYHELKIITCHLGQGASI